MTRRWAAWPLGEVTLKIGSGATPRGGKDVYLAAGTRFIRSQNVVSRRFEPAGLVAISDEAADELRGVAVEPGDVLLNITGESVGRACLVPVSQLPARVSQHVAIIRPDPVRLDSGFLLAALVDSRMQATLNQLSSAGATRRALTKSHLAHLSVQLPPIEEQRRIGNVLGTLDNLIALGRVIARNCDELAYTLWQRMTRESTQRKSVGEIATVVLGGTPDRSRPDFWSGSVPWLNSGKANEFRVIHPTEFVSEAGVAASSTKLMPAGSTLVAITGATLGQMTRLEIEACGNQSLVGVWAEDRPLNDHLFFSLRAGRSTLEQSATGGAQQHINKGDVEALEVPSPSKSALHGWHAVAGPLLNLAADAWLEAAQLESTRDQLSPLLISGQVAVGEFAE